MLCCSISSHGVSLLDEKEVVLAAVRSATGFAVLDIDDRIDSLGLEKTLSGRRPSITAVVEPRFPIIEPRPEPSVGASIRAGETLPGGGRLGTTLATTRGPSTDSLPATSSSTLDISFTQPLLRNAWDYSPLDYEIRLARLERDQFTLNHIQRIISEVSSVRYQYWSLYEKRFLERVLSARADYARERLEIARARFEVGTVPSLDTLSAHLEYLRTHHSLLGARSQARLAHLALADTLNMMPENLRIDTSDVVVIESLPDAEVLLREIEEFDPQLQLFEILAQSLEEQRRNAARSLLPTADIGISYSRSFRGDSWLGNNRFDKDNALVSLVLSYELPTKSRRLDVKQHALRIEKNQLRTERYETTLVRRVEELRLVWGNELEALAVSEAEVRIAQQQLNAALAGYEVGTVDAVTLSKAETDYLDAVVRNIGSKIVLKRLEIGLDESTGRTLDRFGIAWNE